MDAEELRKTAVARGDEIPDDVSPQPSRLHGALAQFLFFADLRLQLHHTGNRLHGPVDRAPPVLHPNESKERRGLEAARDHPLRRGGARPFCFAYARTHDAWTVSTA